MLVYDITSEKSFDNIKNWIRNIEEVREKTNERMKNIRLISARLSGCRKDVDRK